MARESRVNRLRGKRPTITYMHRWAGVPREGERLNRLQISEPYGVPIKRDTAIGDSLRPSNRQATLGSWTHDIRRDANI